MRNIKEFKNTTNRKVYNQARKAHLERTGKIRCSYCKYNHGENKTTKTYGGFEDENPTFPSWKLISKNKKQWMKTKIKIKRTKSKVFNKHYIEFLV
jgi:septin family protein